MIHARAASPALPLTANHGVCWSLPPCGAVPTGEAMLDILQSVLEFLASAARAMWPGVLAAGALGYLGYSLMGTPGFVVGSGLGAFLGTWAGAHLGLVPIRRMTGSVANDRILQAGGAFVVVGICYFLLHSAIFIVALIAVAAVLFWLAG